jgi:hypothetical protein
VPCIGAVTASPNAAAPACAAFARLGLLANDTGGAAACRAVADGQVAGQRHLEAAAAHLDDDGLARDGVFLLDGVATGERLDGVVPLGLDPAGAR